MKMATVTQAAKLLDISPARIRRDAKAGKIDHMIIGVNTLVVDVDHAREVYAAKLNRVGVGRQELSEITGL